MSQAGAIGCHKEELDTPVLLLDLDVLEANIRYMADIIVRQAGVGWRPHTKGMKTPALAHKLIAAGAHGITCAKLGEAEIMAYAGVGDILVANQVVGERKIERLVNLRRHSDVAVLVDDLDTVNQIGSAARAKGVQVRVLIEVEVGMERAGIGAGEPTLEFARHVAACEGVQLAGLQCWESQAIRIVDQEEKRRMILEALQLITGTADLCRQAGLPIDIVSCGGTGTFAMSSFAPGITEIEAGGGIYGDRQYTESFHVPGIECALFVRSTVTSHPTPTRFICDAGKKTMSNDATPPELVDVDGVTDLALSAEHAIVRLEAPSVGPKVGEQLEFRTGYSDTTVVLHDEVYGIRDGIVEVIWPLWGRGRLT